MKKTIIGLCAILFVLNMGYVQAANFDTPYLMAKKSFEWIAIISCDKKIKNIFLHFETLKPSKKFKGWGLSPMVKKEVLTQYFIAVLKRTLEDRGYLFAKTADEADLILNLKIEPDGIEVPRGAPFWTREKRTALVSLLKVETTYITNQGEWKNIFVGHENYSDWDGLHGHYEIGPIELAEGITKVVEQASIKNITGSGLNIKKHRGQASPVSPKGAEAF